MKSVNTLNDLIIALEKGFPICFKTDTIWGLSIKPTTKKNIEKLYNIKKRNINKPLIYLISKNQNLNDIVEEITPLHNKLMNAFWPGPLTIIFNAKKDTNVMQNQHYQETIALRMPDDNLTQELLGKINYILPTTSVNIEGKIPLNNYNEIINEFKNENIYILKDLFVQILFSD